MGVEQPLHFRKLQHKPGRSVLVLRIPLDNESVRACLSNLLFANVPLHSTPKRMLGEVEFALPELPADLL